MDMACATRKWHVNKEEMRYFAPERTASISQHAGSRSDHGQAGLSGCIAATNPPPYFQRRGSCVVTDESVSLCTLSCVGCWIVVLCTQVVS